jgi:hypothetical protein
MPLLESLSYNVMQLYFSSPRRRVGRGRQREMTDVLNLFLARANL